MTNFLPATSNASPSVESEFDRFAGASYGLALMREFFGESNSSIGSPMLLWPFVSHALLRGNQSEPASYILEQMTVLAASADTLDRDFGSAVQKEFEQLFTHSWAAWLPILIFSPDWQRDSIWTQYIERFPGESDQEKGIQRLLAALMTRTELEMLYDPTGLDPRFSSQFDCPMVRVGILLRRFIDNGENSDLTPLFTGWRGSLKTILQDLQDGKRIRRGFAKESPLFEDLVLALLYVAEWRSQSDIWRIGSYIHSYNQYPEECLNLNQLVLCGALFGLLEGYRRVGGSLGNPEWRRLLSSQALALSLKQSTMFDKDLVNFYATEEGTESAIQESFLHVQHGYFKRELIEEKTLKQGQVEGKSKESREAELTLQVATTSFIFYYRFHST